MTIYHATDSTFKKDLRRNGVTLVNFWAPWCGPCRMYAPIIEAYDSENKNDVKILKVNVDENVETAAQFGIMSIPATVLFKNGKPVAKEIGILSKDGLNKWVAKYL